MSGICAVLWRRSPSVAQDSLARLCEGLRVHPTERLERKFNGGVGLGVCRRFAGQQLAEYNGLLVACDADLYNENELRLLANASTEIPSTAVLLAMLYSQFGSSFVDRLRGACSFVLWDTHRRMMFAATDALGINRLAIYQDAPAILISSRVNALAYSGQVDDRINPRAVTQLLNFSSTLAPETILRKVSRLSPGTILSVSVDGVIATKKYWDMRYEPDRRSGEEELERQLEATLQKAVKVNCDDVPFATTGAFLSGGTDSSTVTGMLSRLERGTVKCFSIGFDEQAFDEMDYARIAARHFSANHLTYNVTADDCVRALPSIVRSFDEPYGNASAIPTYFCAKLAAENGVTILLAGDGGDEFFGGNERYGIDALFGAYQRLPTILRKGLLDPAVALLPDIGLLGKLRRYVRRSNIPAMERYFSYHFLSAHDQTKVFDREFIAELDGYSPLQIPAELYERASAQDHLNRLLYIDLHITLADNDLPKVTRMSELAGIRSRFPLLDREVGEFSGRLPHTLKVKGLKKRYLFKRALRNFLPTAVLTKKKHGFGIPVAMWLKTHRDLRDMCRDTLFSRASRERGVFRPDFIANLVSKNGEEDSTYYGDTLWTVFVCEHWCQQFLDHKVTVQ